MGVIDKVSVGGTTYDVQDTAARAYTQEAFDVAGIVDYGSVRGDQTSTLNGVTVVRNGTRITVNGTCKTTIERFRMSGQIAYALTPGADQNASAYGVALKTGHKYVLVMKLLSGTALYGDTISGVPYTMPFITTYVADTTTSAGIQARPLPDETVYRFLDGGQSVVPWWGCYKGNSFTNAVYDISLIDLTATTNVIPVTDSAVTISAIPDCRYVCSAAYVTSLSFTPSATGICSVRFTSGTTPTVLTLPNTVKMPSWWNGCAANTTYEISIADGVYGAVGVWT